jgi:hypothetical protein
MNWLALAAAAFALALLVLIVSGLGDAPCQDGDWDASSEACIAEAPGL